MTVSDAKGKTEFTQTEVASSNGTVYTKLRTLATGVYLVNVRSDNKNKTLKIIIE